MSYYSVEEKLMFVKWYYGGNSMQQVRQMFSVKFPERQVPSKQTISNTIKRLEETGSVNKPCRCNKLAPNRDNETVENVILKVVENKNNSLRKIAKDINISHTTVRNILKDNKYKSFKYHRSQELKESDFYNRMIFCEIMMELCNSNRNFLSHILFSDEKTFSTHGLFNSQNYRYWDTVNNHLVVPVNSQYRKAVNVWVGILGHVIIGPYFIDGPLNEHKYLELLQESVGPAIANIGDQDLWFQHDGCPAHYSVLVREYLNEVFPGRWIGRGGVVPWPARSPDLSPNDFFLWGYLETKIYSHEETYKSINDLKDALIRECGKISHYTLTRVRNEFFNRLGYCLASEGGLFEHKI